MFLRLYLYLILGLGIIVSSCKSDVDISLMEIKVPCSDTDIISIHDLNLIKSIDIVQLQSDGSSMVGNVDKIISCDTLLYMMDRSVQKVWIYDIQGRHVSTIDHKGHGPNEYVQLTDMFIDDEHGTLNLLSRIEHKMLLYDLSGKIYLGQKKLPKAFMAMSKVLGGYIGYMGNYSEDTLNPDNFWILNDSLDIVGSKVPIDPKLESRHKVNMRPLSTYKGKCNCICQMDRNVYIAGAIEIQPHCQFDFGSMNLPELSKEELDDPQRMFEVSNSHITGIEYFQETDDHLLALCLFHGQQVLVVYEKDNQNVNMASLGVDENKYFLNFGRIQGMDEHHIYAVLEAKNVYDVYNGGNQYNNFEETHPQQVANLRKKLGNLQKDDNPYIMIYSIK